ncbi:transposase [Candidatus Woesebacteria bacterium]|nr:transposase [Candidatus Woesebacteria bacterium]
MPSKNSLKIDIENGYYHIYNRGVEKRIIFQDTQDYKVFLKYLKESLSPLPDPKNLEKNFTLQGTSFKGVPRQPKNFYRKIELHSFCLMPNHFHLLIKQIEKGSMQGLMRSLLTRYSTYFNKKYKRVGPLFQGRYKAVLVNNEEYLLHLTRYIHLNPTEYTKNIVSWYSSYADYLSLRKTKWVKPKFVLAFFNNQTIPEIKKYNSYKNFVEKYEQDSKKILGELTLELEKEV